MTSAAASASASPAFPRRPAIGPIRMCVGCRQRAAAGDLLRVVIEPNTSPSASGLAVSVLRPDPRRRAPGRGAWVHVDQACVATAERRRAFARALRVTGSPDLSAVVRYLGAQPSSVASSAAARSAAVAEQ